MAARITVDAPGASYDICIDTDLSGLRDFEASAGVIVTNTTLAPLYSETLRKLLPNTTLITIPDGEQYKTLATAADLYTRFVGAGLDRHGYVLAFGGGVVGDVAGFAAATYMRGVELVQIPTSLLAMVDSSVGGKVGVDMPQGKNLVGAFKQPRLVLIGLDVLRTLPPEQRRCGMAEVIKHGLLADPLLLDETLYNGGNDFDLVRRAVQVKVDIVQQDPFEKDIRAHLNLGHTFAHAIERVSRYEWLHGEAVGVGLLAAARLSYRLGLCDAALVNLVEATLRKIGLRCQIDDFSPEAIYAAMATDKKWKHGHSRFVLLEDVGHPVIVEDVPKAEIIAVLMSLTSSSTV